MSQIELVDLKPSLSDFKADVIEGLSQKQKTIPPKYFYDEQGSKLFDQICELEEYYPTRTETKILSDNAARIDKLLPETCLVLEYGSGSSIKIKKLLQSSKKIRSYVPLDISKEHLMESAKKVSSSFPNLDVTAICADYTTSDLSEFNSNSHLAHVVFFPGSTIGNLLLDEARSLLEKTRTIIKDDGLLILGIDLIKDTNTLERAYNDSKGVTANFNLNLLTRMNRELDANFDKDSYRHQAVFNQLSKRIEMHLVSTIDQDIEVAGHSFSFQENESIHTENSHKFTINGFLSMAKEAGLESESIMTDDKENFAVMILKATPNQ